RHGDLVQEVSEDTVSEDCLEEMVIRNIEQYGRTYGRGMMQGTLHYQLQQGSCHREISQRRISSMLRKVAPSAHNERAHDVLDKTNP
ncbi:hypothetical protein P5673_012426, partial [Acropora cervicornis]